MKAATVAIKAYLLFPILLLSWGLKVKNEIRNILLNLLQ